MLIIIKQKAISGKIEFDGKKAASIQNKIETPNKAILMPLLLPINILPIKAKKKQGIIKFAIPF